MLKVKQLYKSFGDLEVLKGIDVTLTKGETIAIIGPSGSGKSTLLRCMNLLEIPDAGKIEIDTIQVTAPTISKKEVQQVRLATAMVFQDYCLFANKSILHNIVTPLIVVKKWPKDKATIKALELLEKVGLLEKKEMRPSQLSGGQQQRVGIARALALHPQVLLFDEPTSALDPELVQEVLQVIKQIVKEQITSIIVTHEIQFAYDVADRILFMDEGRIIEQGPAKEVIEHPQKERTKKFLQKYKY